MNSPSIAPEVFTDTNFEKSVREKLKAGPGRFLGTVVRSVYSTQPRD